MINPFDLSQLIFCSPGSTGCSLDKSVEMLGDIFGTNATQAITLPSGVPGTAISGMPTSVSLFSMMIGYFNIASVGIVTVIFTYMVIIATINTAHEGTPFGRQNHTTFLLIRSILGPVLMFPLPIGPAGSGLSFSALQAVIMHLVLIGVNLANAVWSNTMTDALAVPPAQLPGPVKNLVAEQVAKLFLYKAAYNVMGMTSLDDPKGPQIAVGPTTENVLQDPQLYNAMMNEFASDCAQNVQISGQMNNYNNPNTDPNALKTAQTLCTQAVSKMGTNQWTGIVYPLSAGRDLNGTNSNSASLLYNRENADLSAYDTSYYVQYQFSFGNQFPYLANGQANVSGMTYQVSKISTAVDPNTTPANPFGSTLEEVLTSMHTANPNLFNSIIPINTATPPNVTPVDCSGAGTASGSPCDMYNIVTTMTNSLIKTAVTTAQQEKENGLLQTIVPGTGKTCILDPSISAAVDANGNVVIGGNTTPNNDNSNITVSGNFGTEPATNSNSTTNAQCVREETTGFSPANPSGTVTYVAIPAQDYSQSWWYGSEVYLAINAQLAQNINNIAKMIQQFSISDNSLQFSVVAQSGNLPTKSVTYRAIEKIRNNWGHNVSTAYDLSPDFAGTPLTPDYIPQVYYTKTFTYGPPDLTPKPDFSSATFDPPSWANTICVFQDVSSFLNASQPSTINNPTAVPNSCFTANNGMGNYIVQPMSQVQGQTNAAYANNPNLYAELQTVPPDYQMPIQLMILWEIETNFKQYANLPNANALETQSIEALASNIENILAILKLNHVYPGSATGDGGGSVGVNTSSEIQPAQNLLMEMFNQVLGKNTSGAMSTDLNQNIGGVMNDLYSLGNQEIVAAPGSGQAGAMDAVIANSYNNIANAQQVGIEMINLVVFAIEEVYTEIKTQADSDISSDHNIYQNMITMAGTGAGVGGLASFLNPEIGTMVNTTIQVGELAYSIQLQNELVKQSFDLGSMIMWLPLIITTCTSLFTAGISFALIIPIMPFILYWTGQIAWLLSVMEAIVAAPLLCLAWAAPGGHHHWGNTLGGLRIMIGIVFRPVLMVIGLFAALILTFVLIQFSSQAFQIVSSQVLSFSASFSATPPTYWAGTTTVYTNPVSITEGILAVLMLLLYCSVMVMAFTKCYSTIYAIPEHVLKWIGVDASSGSAQDMEKLTGSVTQNAGQTGQAAGQTMSQGAQTQSSHMSQSGQADQSNAGAVNKAADSGVAIGSAGNKAYKKSKGQNNAEDDAEDGAGAAGA